jgi:hypothetical protein
MQYKKVPKTYHSPPVEDAMRDDAIRREAKLHRALIEIIAEEQKPNASREALQHFHDFTVALALAALRPD